MENKSSINPASRRIAPNTYAISGQNSAIVTFEALPDKATLDVGRITTVQRPGGAGAVKIMYWGSDNGLPYSREELITGNNIVPALIERKRNILAGQGWYAYKEKFIDDGSGQMIRDQDEVPMPPDAQAFFKQFKKVSRSLIGEILKHGMAMPEFVRFKRDGMKIKSIRSLKMKHVRAGKKNAEGDIPVWYWSNIWQKNNKVETADKVIRELPVYDTEATKKQGRFVLPLIDDLFDDEYYPVPAWWGGRHWISLSNIVPLFHEANLAHGAAPRFHLIIPHDYFFDYEAMNATAEGSDERAELIGKFQAAEQAFVDDVTEVLAGVANAGRVITSKSEIIEAMGSKYDRRIQIEEIKYDMRDEALIKLFEASNVANISAQALHPTLASIETAGKLSSGTEIRNAFLMYLIIAAPAIRDMLQEVVDLVKMENGWPADIHYAIRDAEMTTLAENPAGVRPAQTPIGQ